MVIAQVASGQAREKKKKNEINSPSAPVSASLRPNLTYTTSPNPRAPKTPDMNQKMPQAAVQLKDPSLLRTACYVNGKWVAAQTGKVFSVESTAS